MPSQGGPYELPNRRNCHYHICRCGYFWECVGPVPEGRVCRDLPNPPVGNEPWSCSRCYREALELARQAARRPVPPPKLF